MSYLVQKPLTEYIYQDYEPNSNHTKIAKNMKKSGKSERKGEKNVQPQRDNTNSHLPRNKFDKISYYILRLNI